MGCLSVLHTINAAANEVFMHFVIRVQTELSHWGNVQYSKGCDTYTDSQKEIG